MIKTETYDFYNYSLEVHYKVESLTTTKGSHTATEEELFYHDSKLLFKGKPVRNDELEEWIINNVCSNE